MSERSRSDALRDVKTDADDDLEAADDASFKPLSRQEAEALRARHPTTVSPARVVVAQAFVGSVVAALAWAVTRRVDVVGSALYGAAIVVLPSALLARGMSRSNPADAGAAAFRFLLWEAVKVGCAVVMLVAAPRIVPGVNWPALLVAMLVCMKVNWLALLWQGRASKNGRSGHD